MKNALELERPFSQHLMLGVVISHPLLSQSRDCLFLAQALTLPSLLSVCFAITSYCISLPTIVVTSDLYQKILLSLIRTLFLEQNTTEGLSQQIFVGIETKSTMCILDIKNFNHTIWVVVS